MKPEKQSGETSEREGKSNLLLASEDEKRAFLDFIHESFEDEGEPYLEYEEEAVNAFIIMFHNMVVRSGIGNPTNLRDLTALLDDKFVRFGLAMGRLLEEAETGVTGPRFDLTEASESEKRSFFNSIKEIAAKHYGDPGEYDENQIDDIITIWTDIFAIFGGNPRDLDDLALFFRHVVELGSPMAKSEEKKGIQCGRDFEKLIGAVGILPPEDQLPMIKNALGRIAREFINIESEFDEETDAIVEDHNGDPGTIGEALGSAIHKATQQIMVEQQETLVRTFHEGIEKRLDDIQEKLGALYINQEVLEKVQDQIAELAAAKDKKSEFGEVPPMPVIDETSPSKKEYTTERERITATVDPVLFELFHEERKARGVTVSRMQDIILWQRYGKPKLSFEIKVDESPRSAPKAKESEPRADQKSRSKKKRHQ